MGHFESMSLEGIAVWRTHLYESFTEGASSTYGPPFRFKRKDGTRPLLSMVRMQSQSGEGLLSNTKTAGRGNRKGKGSGGVADGSNAKKSKGAKKKPRKKNAKVSKKDEDFSGEEFQLSDVESEMTDHTESDDDDGDDEPMRKERPYRAKAQKAPNAFSENGSESDARSDSPFVPPKPVKKVSQKIPFPGRKPPPAEDQEPEMELSKISSSKFFQARIQSKFPLPMGWASSISTLAVSFKLYSLSLSWV